jgi:hypothetical protein
MPNQPFFSCESERDKTEQAPPHARSPCAVCMEQHAWWLPIRRPLTSRAYPRQLGSDVLPAGPHMTP